MTRREVPSAAGRMGEVLREALLLPPRAAPPVPGLSLSVTYAPASAEQPVAEPVPVGGDFFDAFALPGREVVLVVGDMAGKGLDAAVHTAAVKYALRAFLRDRGQGPPACPAAALARLNDFVCQAQELDGWAPGALASVALVILNTVTGEGRFALAAAETPLVLREGEAEPAGGGAPPYGLPLGALAGQGYGAAPLFLPAGAPLLLFTDGLTEARRPGRTPSGGIALLGYEGVARLAAVTAAAAAGAGAGCEALGDPLSGIGSGLLERVSAYAGGRLRDDTCLLLARREHII